MKKQVLLDLSVLKHPYCGLGQIALNYCYYFKHNDLSQLPFEITLMLPKHLKGIAGDGVKYLPITLLHKLFPFIIPKFDVWHSLHQYSNFHPLFKDTRYLLTIHDFNLVYEKTNKKLQRYMKTIRKEIDRANHITVISKFTESELLRYASDVCINKPISVIYNGVETLNQYGLCAKCPKSIIEGDSFFFTIGQVREKKNFHVLLPMMKYFPKYQLYIAGKNNTEYAKKIQQTIEEQKISNVRLIGNISSEERLWLYQHCEAFLFPSLFEGFGLPVIEAMQFGKPVITSGQTSLKEIGGGYCYEWKDFEPKTMASFLIKSLMDFSAQPQKREEQIAYAMSFTYKKNIDAYFKLYSELCKTNI